MHFGGAMFFTDYSMSAPELARALEERGFESVWAPEHSHIPLSRKTPFPGGGEVPKQYYDAMDPFVVLAAASQVTKRIKFGTGVALIQQRDVIQTAKLVASIDQVSQGRFLFGVGGGWNQDEMEDHGTVYATRFKRVRESIEAMKEIWTKETAEYHGEFVNFDPGDELEHFCRKSQQLGSAHSIFSKTQEARRQSHRQSRPRPKSSSQRTPRWRGVDSNFRFREGSLEKPLSLFSGGRKVRIPLSADMILLWHPPTYRRSAHYRSHRL